MAPPRTTVFFCFYTAFPPSGGASWVSYQVARHWPGRRVLLQMGPSATRARPEDGDFEVVTIPEPRAGRFGKLIGMPRLIAGMCREAKAQQADLLVLEGASWAAYLSLLLRRLRREMPHAQTLYHAHNVEYELRKQKHSRAVAAITWLCERAIVRTADRVTAVSQRDRRVLRRLYGIDADLLPNGVDVGWLTSASTANVAAARQRLGLGHQVVLYMGAYAYRPNREALDFLVQEVFPAVHERHPQAQLLVIGGTLPYKRPWLVNPGLLPAEQLPATIAAAAVCAAPIFSGSGTRLKVLEALAVGVPVVATPKGVEGLPLRPGDVTLARSAGAFADALGAWLRRAEAGDAIAPSAAELMRSKFGWPGIVGAVVDSTTADAGAGRTDEPAGST